LGSRNWGGARRKKGTGNDGGLGWGKIDQRGKVDLTPKKETVDRKKGAERTVKKQEPSQTR